MRNIDSNNILYLGEILNTIDSGIVIKSDDSDLHIMRMNYTQIFNIPTIETTISAPFANRPILQQVFELSCNKKCFGNSIEKECIRNISRIVGDPYSSKSFNTRKWHEIRYSARWKYGDVKLSLSVFGSERNGKYGKSNASLFL